MNQAYTTYTLQQLAEDDDFIRWVLHGEADASWRDWLDQHPEQQSKIHAARRLIESLQVVSGIPFSESAQSELWNRIHTSTQAEVRPLVRKSLRPLWTWGLAAAASLALLVWYNTVTFADTAFARYGETMELSLPGESLVTLNAGAFITYKESSFEKNRTLHLEGEAFFEVTPGTTFTVNTPGGSITVLGTSFNVIAWPDRFEVSCFTGKVKVESDGAQKITLEAGQKSTQSQSDKTLHRSVLDTPGSDPEWMSGRFRFEDQPLSIVAAELERQYNIRVTMDREIADLRYTGVFESGDLDKALSLITWPLHLDALVAGKTVTISR